MTSCHLRILQNSLVDVGFIVEWSIQENQEAIIGKYWERFACTSHIVEHNLHSLMWIELISIQAGHTDTDTDTKFSYSYVHSWAPQLWMQLLKTELNDLNNICTQNTFKCWGRLCINPKAEMANSTLAALLLDNSRTMEKYAFAILLHFKRNNPILKECNSAFVTKQPRRLLSAVADTEGLW